MVYYYYIWWTKYWNNEIVYLLHKKTEVFHDIQSGHSQL